MNTRTLTTAVVAGLLLITGSAFAAKDEVRIVSASKVAAASRDVREKAATDWMSEEALRKEVQQRWDKGQQMIYFEWHTGKQMWRGIFTDKIKLRNYSWWCYYGENEITAKLNSEMKEGKKPAFIVRTGITYAMLMVQPDQLEEAKKVLAEFGIGEPKIK